MANISLESSIRGCKVDTGWANKIESDRFLNPSQMVCIPWNGFDLTGRRVCPDSFYTKTAGCNSAEDRVVVENAHRPQYIDYVQLQAAGIRGNIYGNTEAQTQMKNSAKVFGNMYNNNPHYGNTAFNSQVKYSSTCANNSYNQAMAQMATTSRQVQAAQTGMVGNNNQNASGMY
jgi:hypothetical protein